MAVILKSLESVEKLLTKNIKFLGLLGNNSWLPIKQQRRNLNVHEHISYTLLKDAGIDVPKFGVAKTKEEAKKIAAGLGTKDIALKAQVLSGGRGVGTFKNGLKGGVRMVSTPEEAEKDAGQMLGQLLVTKQSGPDGILCNTVMVAERKYPKKEFYFAIMMERAFGGPVVIASSQGGVNIEDVAEKTPDAIFYEPIDITKGLSKDQAEKVAKKVGLDAQKDKIGKMLLNMYKLFVAKDALLIEINPYAEDEKKNYYALDAKFRFDDNASFRQKALFAMRDETQEDPKEIQALKYDLNYIALDGSIGCMVNGAGLAMATMDIIVLHGGQPANFLDVGGSATAEAVKEAFKIITSDKKVKAIFVNIFGGIMRCDIIAEGIIAATKELGLKVPIVVRLQGTNVEKANVLIKNSGLKITSNDNFDQAARAVCQLIKK